MRRFVYAMALVVGVAAATVLSASHAEAEPHSARVIVNTYGAENTCEDAGTASFGPGQTTWSCEPDFYDGFWSLWVDVTEV
jgi:hypothetical protein